jgi:hypothetical protein
MEAHLDWVESSKYKHTVDGRKLHSQIEKPDLRNVPNHRTVARKDW